jgi:hypothetical protein
MAMGWTMGAAAVAVMATASGVAQAAPAGSERYPIVVKMTRGSDSVRLTGVLRQGRDCCAYVFKAHAGQRLIWRLSGPATRQVITYPDGHTDGPGLPNPLPLPANGAYRLSVRPNLMADGAYGRFTLRLKIPPVGR